MGEYIIWLHQTIGGIGMEYAKYYDIGLNLFCKQFPEPEKIIEEAKENELIRPHDSLYINSMNFMQNNI